MCSCLGHRHSAPEALECAVTGTCRPRRRGIRRVRGAGVPGLLRPRDGASEPGAGPVLPADAVGLLRGSGLGARNGVACFGLAGDSHLGAELAIAEAHRVFVSAGHHPQARVPARQSAEGPIMPRALSGERANASERTPRAPRHAACPHQPFLKRSQPARRVTGRDARGPTCPRAPQQITDRGPAQPTRLSAKRRDGVVAPILARAAAPWRHPFKASARRRNGARAAAYLATLAARVTRAAGRTDRC
jgi:hypothetical protein